MTYRQVWVKGTAQPCEHTRTNDIKSNGGEVIAKTCALCGVLVGQKANCDGCGRQGVWCTKWKEKKTHYLRWCDGRCETDWNDRKKEERRLAKLVVAKV